MAAADQFRQAGSSLLQVVQWVDSLGEEHRHLKNAVGAVIERYAAV